MPEADSDPARQVLAEALQADPPPRRLCFDACARRAAPADPERTPPPEGTLRSAAEPARAPPGLPDPRRPVRHQARRQVHADRNPPHLADERQAGPSVAMPLLPQVPADPEFRLGRTSGVLLKKLVQRPQPPLGGDHREDNPQQEDGEVRPGPPVQSVADRHGKQRHGRHDRPGVRQVGHGESASLAQRQRGAGQDPLEFTGHRVLLSLLENR